MRILTRVVAALCGCVVALAPRLPVGVQTTFRLLGGPLNRPPGGGRGLRRGRSRFTVALGLPAAPGA